LLLFVMPSSHWDLSLFVSLRTGGWSEINYRDFSLKEQPFVALRELARVRALFCWTVAIAGPVGHLIHRNRNRKQERKS